MSRVGWVRGVAACVLLVLTVSGCGTASAPVGISTAPDVAARPIPVDEAGPSPRAADGPTAEPGRDHAGRRGAGARAEQRRIARALDRDVRALAGRTGIPVPAMRAYARAAWTAPASCHLNWPTLAAIGQIESDHGRFGATRLRADGTLSAPILGPRLDGVGDVAPIPATPLGTRLHGDRRWEHALGPMQFLPDTWKRWRADGDGDGRRDPQDLDDAAFTTAHYLCGDGRDLLAPGAWKAAILAYNHSEKYSLLVYAATDHYNRLG